MANRADSDIESFAELTARLEHPFADRVAILRSAGLDEVAYLRHRDLWTAELAGAPSSALAQRFGDTYARAINALAAGRCGDAAATSDPRFLNTDAQPFREEAAVVGREIVLSSAPPAAIKPIPAAEVPSVLFAVPPAMRHFTGIRETEPTVGPPPAGPVLPFHSSSTQPEPPEPRESLSWMPKGMRSFTSIGETQPAPDAPSGPALPFAKAQDRGDLQETRDGKPGTSVRNEMADPTLSETPRLSLDEHARLCVELALYPAYRPAILQRYGLDEDQRQQLAAFWGARINADANLRMSWDDLCAAHRAQLLSSDNPKR